MQPTKKAVSPVAINCLVEALTHAYWYKNQLKNFLIQTLTDSTLLGRLNWDEPKRTIVSNLTSYLARNQDRYLPDLVNLMTAISDMNDYSHLEKLEDGKAKAQKAATCIEALRKQISGYTNLVQEQKNIEQRRADAQERQATIRDFHQCLAEIKDDFFQLHSMTSPQKRGYQLEKIIRNLFELFDMDPKASFRITGEQIDGAFTFANNDYLFEAKWQQHPCDIQDLDAFKGKIERRLDNTLGLFCSINGFSDDGITAHSSGRRLMLLMDAADLMSVLDGRIKLDELLLRKRQHAAQTGKIFFSVKEILAGN